MTTRQLLWGMMWRGFGGGVMGGVISGIVYPVIVIALAQFYSVLATPPPSNDGGPFYIFFLLSLLVGLFGLVANTMSGFLSGLLLGIFTRTSFSSLRTEHYRMSAKVIGIIGGAITGVSIYCWGFAQFYGGFGKIPRDVLPVLIILVVTIPSSITAAITVFINLQLAKWYERESTKGIAQNVSPN